MSLDTTAMNLPWSYFTQGADVFADPIVRFTEDMSVIKYFTQGQCNALAWEIAKLAPDQFTAAILSDDLVGQEDYMGHVFVMDRQGYAVDIRGKMTLPVMRSYWPRLRFFHNFTSIKDFHYEMSLWENETPYDRDVLAVEWARKIVDKLNIA